VVEQALMRLCTPTLALQSEGYSQQPKVLLHFAACADRQGLLLQSCAELLQGCDCQE
jgi:hypothetical protein